MPEYFFVLITLLIVTLVLHHLSKVRIYKSKAHLLALNLIIFMVATIWDQFAIYRGHWTFGTQFLLGPKIGFMPIEEFMFILIISYFGLVIFRILEKKFGS